MGGKKKWQDETESRTNGSLFGRLPPKSESTTRLFGCGRLVAGYGTDGGEKAEPARFLSTWTPLRYCGICTRSDQTTNTEGAKNVSFEAESGRNDCHRGRDHHNGCLNKGRQNQDWNRSSKGNASASIRGLRVYSWSCTTERTWKWDEHAARKRRAARRSTSRFSIGNTAGR